jgi:hypothetical protein
MGSFSAVFSASARAARAFAHRDILWHALWPPLLAFAVWAVIAWLTWQQLAHWLLGQMPDWSWLHWFGPYLVYVVLALVFAPLIYFTALFLVAVIALPHMMDIVAESDYPDVSRYGDAKAAFWGSLWNTVTAGIIFIVGWLLTLPLLLVPGGLLILPLLWSAWLNQRTFGYDVLAGHATAKERDKLIAQTGGRFWLAGFLAALMAHVPILNVLAPSFCALLFAHLGLSALRDARGKEGVLVK